MCAGGPGSIPGADNLDSGFHPSGVGKISYNQYLEKTANVNRAAVRMATCGLCSRRRKLPHVCFLAVSAGDLDVAIVTKAPKKLSDIYIFTFIYRTSKRGYRKPKQNVILHTYILRRQKPAFLLYAAFHINYALLLVALLRR
jgi:hypothetical protein